MLGKLINGELHKPTEYERQKIVITNPSDESLKFNMGYKEVVESEKPEYDEETEYLKPVYSETDGEIFVSYEVLSAVQI